MKPSNTEILKQLNEITKNLLFSSETTSGFEPFLWETNEHGVLNLENFLQSEGFLFPFEPNNFLEFVSSEASWSPWGSSTPSEVAIKMNLKYTEIIDFFCSHLKTLSVYLVSNLGEKDSTVRKKAFKKSLFGNPEHYLLPVDEIHEPYIRGEICIEQEAFHIVIGETFDGEWLGITPKMYRANGRRGGERFVLDKASVNENTIDLKLSLEAMALELEFSVVEFLAFYRKNEAVVEVGCIKEELLYRLLGSMGFFRAFTFEDYCNEDCTNPSEFRLLDEFLRSNLNNLQEYIVGSTARYFIYSIGHTEEKDVLGISTLANWT